jgi:signal transduction histidine kinase
MTSKDTTDARAGARWLATLGPVDRLQLLAALLSRFNHDFRTPLNTLVGWGHLLQQETLEPVRIRHGAEVVERNTRTLALTLDEFIEDSRVILGGSPIESQTVSVAEVLTQAAGQSGVADPAGGRLHIRVDAEDTVVRGDFRRLQRCISRLVAVVAHRAHESAAIELGVSRVERTICLSVAAPARARDGDWSSADLLDLRIATLVAESLGGALELPAASRTATALLWLPVANRN